jgi:hypothetical protein
LFARSYSRNYSLVQVYCRYVDELYDVNYAYVDAQRPHEQLVGIGLPFLFLSLLLGIPSSALYIDDDDVVRI